jgi:membrane protein DedA with SNARE-associated domain
VLFDNWGWYASIYFWMLFTGVGIPPVPEEAGILYAAGVTSLHPGVHWWLAWPVTSLGIVSADVALYGIGRLWGQRLFQTRWVKWLLPPERRQRIEGRFHEHGVKILTAARLLPPLRSGVFLIAGTIHFSFVRFLVADLLVAGIGVGILFFSGKWLIDVIGRATHWLIYVAAAAVILYLLYRYYRYLRQQEIRLVTQQPRPEPEVSPHISTEDQPHTCQSSPQSQNKKASSA